MACSGDLVTGGGYSTDPVLVKISPYWNGPTSSAWKVEILNLDVTGVKLTAYAVCADMP